MTKIISISLIILSLLISEIISQSINEERMKGLNQHNLYRKKHRVPGLVLDPKLNNIAQAYSKVLANEASLRHSRSPYGENLFYQCSSGPITIKDAIKMATERWYNEVKDYRYGNSYVLSALHFTQVVWKNSKKLGLGVSMGKKGGMNCVYVVANYDPPGNNGAYKENVLKP